MNIEGLDTTNVWLAIIAMVSVIQILTLGAIAVFAYRLYSKAMTVVDNLEARHVVPLVARANHIMDEAQQVISHVKDAEDAVREKMKYVAEAAGFAVSVVRSRTWPVLGILRGVRAALSAVAARTDATQHAGTPTPSEFRRTSIPQGGTDVRATI